MAVYWSWPICTMLHQCTFVISLVLVSAPLQKSVRAETRYRCNNPCVLKPGNAVLFSTAWWHSQFLATLHYIAATEGMMQQLHLEICCQHHVLDTAVIIGGEAPSCGLGNLRHSTCTQNKTSFQGLPSDPSKSKHTMERWKLYRLHKYKMFVHILLVTVLLSVHIYIYMVVTLHGKIPHPSPPSRV